MRGSRPSQMFSATLSSGSTASSWYTAAMPAARASAGEAKCTAAPSMQDLARARRMHAGQQVHQGRLARAVGSGQGVDLAAIRDEVDRFERRDGAEALAQAADLEQRRAAGAAWPSCVTSA